MKMKSYLFIVAIAAAVTIFSACAHLDPSADPLVVNAERLEAVATSAFDSAVNLDNSNRPFWQTNAPAFHAFAEWLRAPVVIEQQGAFPRGLAMVKLVDDAKLTYKANRAQSNILLNAVADLQTAVIQAQSWNNIISNTNH